MKKNNRIEMRLCPCKHGKKDKIVEKRKYGVNFCDVYDATSFIPVLLYNTLTTYLLHAKKIVVLEKKFVQEIETHIKNLKLYIDLEREGIYEKNKYSKQYKEALVWIADNTPRLWI